MKVANIKILEAEYGLWKKRDVFRGRYKGKVLLPLFASSYLIDSIYMSSFIMTCYFSVSPWSVVMLKHVVLRSLIECKCSQHAIG